MFANFEMYLEPLKGISSLRPFIHPSLPPSLPSTGGEKMLAATSIQVYVRRWRPSTHTVDLTDEVVVTESTPDHLRKKARHVMYL